MPRAEAKGTTGATGNTGSAGSTGSEVRAPSTPPSLISRSYSTPSARRPACRRRITLGDAGPLEEAPAQQVEGGDGRELAHPVPVAGQAHAQDLRRPLGQGQGDEHRPR